MPTDNTKTWTPAVPLKRPDNIVSSDYGRTSKIFTPSYERECRPCMNQLIANEYQRIWWEERRAWEKNRADKKHVKKSQPKHDEHSQKASKKKSTKVSANKKKEKSNEGVASREDEKKLNPRHEADKS